MYKRGPIQLYLGHEMRTANETKESYYNLETIWWLPFSFVSRIKGLYEKLYVSLQSVLYYFSSFSSSHGRTWI